eukprot:COSAG01_NODE_1536_length_9988_cov_5.096673_7_plen_120_part_00
MGGARASGGRCDKMVFKMLAELDERFKRAEATWERNKEENKLKQAKAEEKRRSAGLSPTRLLRPCHQPARALPSHAPLLVWLSFARLGAGAPREAASIFGGCFDRDLPTYVASVLVTKY